MMELIIDLPINKALLRIEQRFIHVDNWHRISDDFTRAIFKSGMKISVRSFGDRTIIFAEEITNLTQWEITLCQLSREFLKDYT